MYIYILYIYIYCIYIYVCIYILYRYIYIVCIYIVYIYIQHIYNIQYRHIIRKCKMCDMRCIIYPDIYTIQVSCICIQIYTLHTDSSYDRNTLESNLPTIHIRTSGINLDHPGMTGVLRQSKSNIYR